MLEKTLSTVFFFVFLFLFLPISLACIDITKTINSTTANLMEPLEVKINISNRCGIEKNLTVIEFFEGEIVYPKDKVVNVSTKGIIAWIPPHLLWSGIVLNANEERSLVYVFKPIQVGLITIQPTQAIDETGKIYYSNSLKITVVCNNNGKCEPQYGENYLNCPNDCPSGSADGICDGIADGKCDPDCLPNADPDCSFCGNGKCEANENYSNCCQDCGCPKLMKCQNNTCINTCGNGICEAEYGEDYKNCPLDCYKPNYLLFVNIIVAFFFLSFVLYYLLKRKKL